MCSSDLFPSHDSVREHPVKTLLIRQISTHRNQTDHYTVLHERLREKAEKEHAIYLEEIQKRGISKTTHDYLSPLARKREILKHKQKQLKRSYL